ncbi:sigma-70 family RNA polymerase sigma factor [Pseudodesulfovibrio cashew]|uniref:Sigma-70 family RNA polymerase sigma factor n=1 Tax=Pseudodesulfovibrio cashew TaxID=2678688 RepID=A0A6I6JBT0_9BACT|nr:RNA polymerase sigma factor [Pseudodesulfovibrio cashew]QGY38608.1 sigma-70 family RNA polymerase sigma factor [Pseudodesulfovibrio cashew]
MDENYEAEIIREVLLGNPQPFEKLVREYQGPVYGLMLRTVQEPDIAADLAQEAFTKAYARLESFRLGKRFFPWLYTLALNVARDYMRKRGSDLHVFMDDPQDAGPSEDSGAEQERMEARLDGATVFEYVSEMPPKYREALILRFRHDFTMKEIADTLGITVSGAKMRVGRGLDMLRHQFKEVSNVR